MVIGNAAHKVIVGSLGAFSGNEKFCVKLVDLAMCRCAAVGVGAFFWIGGNVVYRIKTVRALPRHTCLCWRWR